MLEGSKPPVGPAVPAAMVVVAQLAERQVVVLEVGGSSPLGHP